MTVVSRSTFISVLMFLSLYISFILFHSIGFVVKALGFVQRLPRKQAPISMQNHTVSIMCRLACVHLSLK